MTQADVNERPKLRVLIADDIQETRRSVRLMLSMNPEVIVVAIAKDGQEAVDLSREHHPDVVILDIYMPKKNGLIAYEEIIQNDADTGCVIITGEGDTDLLGQAMALGAQEYLLKPFSIEELNDAVNRVATVVWENREKRGKARLKDEPSEADLKRQADEYVRTHCTDDRAVRVFERLAQNPACELHWLRTLAMMYVIRNEWHKLSILSVRLEGTTGNEKK